MATASVGIWEEKVAALSIVTKLKQIVKVAPCQCDWCLHTKEKFGFRDRHAQREGEVMTTREETAVSLEPGVCKPGHPTGCGKQQTLA